MRVWLAVCAGDKPDSGPADIRIWSNVLVWRRNRVAAAAPRALSSIQLGGPTSASSKATATMRAAPLGRCVLQRVRRRSPTPGTTTDPEA